MKDKNLKSLLDIASNIEQALQQLLLHSGITKFENDFSSLAYRWEVEDNFFLTKRLKPIHQVNSMDLQDLLYIDLQKKAITANVEHFLKKLPSNNMLLTGSRGTGKSSLARALLQAYAPFGLRLIEVDKEHLIDLAKIIEIVREREERFIVYCDDLSFSANDPKYKSLKVALDGSLTMPSDNVLILATSNRRHLIPEFFSENISSRYDDEEIHPNESSEEKISLSERFGLWLTFPPFTQDEYLSIAAHWLNKFSQTKRKGKNWQEAALQWAQSRGSRSGRVAMQFARNWVANK